MAVWSPTLCSRNTQRQLPWIGIPQSLSDLATAPGSLTTGSTDSVSLRARSASNCRSSSVAHCGFNKNVSGGGGGNKNVFYLKAQHDLSKCYEDLPISKLTTLATRVSNSWLPQVKQKKESTGRIQKVVHKMRKLIENIFLIISKNVRSSKILINDKPSSFKVHFSAREELAK